MLADKQDARYIRREAAMMATLTSSVRPSAGTAGAAGAAAAAAGLGASGFERILPISIVRKMMQVRPTNVTPIPMTTTNALETCIGGYAPFMYSGAIIARRICISTVWKSS